MNRKNIILIAACVVAVLLIYTVDLFKLNYRMAGWNDFGETPVKIDHVQYFVADTPNVIGYTDHTLGQKVTCFEAVAYVETDTQEKYRCCDTGEQISCYAGDFSSDIPPVDDQCVAELQSMFGVPPAPAGAKEYTSYGNCSGGEAVELTVMQLDNDGKIQWKYVKTNSIQIANSVLRCILGPALLLLVGWVIYGIYQRKTAEPVRRF